MYFNSAVRLLQNRFFHFELSLRLFNGLTWSSEAILMSCYCSFRNKTKKLKLFSHFEYLLKKKLIDSHHLYLDLVAMENKILKSKIM